MTVHTELARLAQWIELPPGAIAAHWVVRPRGVGDPNVPGPTDTVLTAFVSISPEGWGEIERKLGPSTGRGTLRVEETLARAILPSAGQGAQTVSGSCVLDGPEYPLANLAKAHYAPGTALRWQDGLVFELFSR